jgi:hypothetical protein
MKRKTLAKSISGFMMDEISKRITLILSLIFICFWTMANPPLASKQQIGMFMNSKTCIVLVDGNLNYNAIIRDAVEKHWTATEYEFINYQEFEKRRYDTKYSFLVLMKGTFDNDPGGISYNYLSLVMGYAVNDVTKMPELCSIPISYSDINIIEYGYAIPSIIKFMQKHAKKLEKKRFLISVRGLHYYNHKSVFKDKVLLFNFDMMSLNANSIPKIKRVYPFHFRLLSTSEIETELASNPPNTLFNFHVGPTESTGAGKCFEMIFDAEGNLYYYHYRKITNENKDGFNRKDLFHIR